MNNFHKKIGVAYLVRGKDHDWIGSCERFINSYTRKPAGIKHTLHVIFKGFEHESDLKLAVEKFKSTRHHSIFVDDDKFDIGAYIEWANHTDEDEVCMFNTSSEILATDWLLKFVNNLRRPDVALVGATSSYESLGELNYSFPQFPNIHIRSSGFMMSREMFCILTRDIPLNSKIDAYHFESGPRSLTRKVLALGKHALLVGRNGRGYSPHLWPHSETFRQGSQDNLLIGDNQTRNYLSLTWNEKREAVVRTWGDFINSKYRL